MAAEGGSDSQQRRRRRRDAEEPEKTELGERELAVAVAQENDEENEERWVGPLPVEATLAKKRKVLEFERVYLDNLPSASMYERSYMHRDVITHVVCTKTDFIITASHDGHVKFWKKIEEGIEFVKHFRSHLGVIESIAVSSEGALFCSVGDDKAMKVFDVVNFDMINMLKLGFYSEKLDIMNPCYDAMFTELQQMRQQLPDMEFGRRMAVERELEKVDAVRLINIVFDETGHFVLYGTMLGIKVINVETNRCVRILGKQENIRVMQLALFQGIAKKHRAATTIEMKASENPVLQNIQADPTIVCTSFKKNRFYMAFAQAISSSRHTRLPSSELILDVSAWKPSRDIKFGLDEKFNSLFIFLLEFTKREPEDTKSADSDRDVFNEKPSKEEVMAATQAEGPKRVSDSAIIHTSMGDIHIKLFPVECPKTVENFCVHSRNGYYNGHTFHRIIKGFMIQTGDPTGTGMGGESIWGGEFEDEFHSTLRHDRPYTLSMANAGSNTNGSQFFITVVPTPWLDNKHTVFGRVTKGMEVVQRISNVKVNPKTDKPYEDVSIINITVK
ncbi:Peptidylprolyl isomerase domain and WD repeat-containing protein 1 [Camelus dromedarius]|uniref:peptidylprolyl isomerase n=1 Tax=Camelus dromedarius TaxID=9838 RepID=A0A5N4EBP7_CAMDR|nr:Peptidylprolyl isomerase domain and WD repeat-containing protein 1 [Camelus dromedarius]